MLKQTMVILSPIGYTLRDMTDRKRLLALSIAFLLPALARGADPMVTVMDPAQLQLSLIHI